MNRCPISLECFSILSISILYILSYSPMAIIRHCEAVRPYLFARKDNSLQANRCFISSHHSSHDRTSRLSDIKSSIVQVNDEVRDRPSIPLISSSGTLFVQPIANKSLRYTTTMPPIFTNIVLVMLSVNTFVSLSQADTHLSICPTWMSNDEGWIVSPDCRITYGINDFGCYKIDAHKGESWKVSGHSLCVVPKYPDLVLIVLLDRSSRAAAGADFSVMICVRSKVETRLSRPIRLDSTICSKTTRHSSVYMSSCKLQSEQIWCYWTPLP